MQLSAAEHEDPQKGEERQTGHSPADADRLDDVPVGRRQCVSIATHVQEFPSRD